LDPQRIAAAIAALLIVAAIVPSPAQRQLNRSIDLIGSQARMPPTDVRVAFAEEQRKPSSFKKPADLPQLEIDVRLVGHIP
jgi:hypothetical protein